MDRYEISQLKSINPGAETMFWIPDQAAGTPGPRVTEAEPPHKEKQP